MALPAVKPLPEATRGRLVAVIRPFLLDAALEALAGAGVEQVLVEQVRGYGRQKGHLEIYEGSGFEGGFLPKVRLEFAVPAEGVAAAVEALRAATFTGRIGDGKIFIHAVETLETA